MNPLRRAQLSCVLQIIVIHPFYCTHESVLVSLPVTAVFIVFWIMRSLWNGWQHDGRNINCLHTLWMLFVKRICTIVNTERVANWEPTVSPLKWLGGWGTDRFYKRVCCIKCFHYFYLSTDITILHIMFLESVPSFWNTYNYMKWWDIMIYLFLLNVIKDSLARWKIRPHFTAWSFETYTITWL